MQSIKWLLIADGIEVIQGDALWAIRNMKFDGRVHVITDPPYEKEMHNAKAGARGKKNYGAQRRIRTDGHANPKPVSFESIEKLRPRITKPLVDLCDGWFIAFCTPEGIAPWRDYIEKAGARYKRACFWDKVDSAPQFNGQGPAYGVECMVTAWCGPGASRWHGGGRRNIFRHSTRGPDREGTHETEKPVPLLLELITLFTDPGDIILDPFMGSGTTGIAAIRSGRKFVGIEKVGRFYELSKRRLLHELSQPNLFLDIPLPKQIKFEGMPAVPRPKPPTSARMVPA